VARVTVSPKRAATFVAWGNAFLAGAADPDSASEAVRGRDLAHLVHGLPGLPEPATLPVALQVLRRDGATGFQLVLPVPGDLYGLPGPPAFNTTALAAGEAVLVKGVPVGLVPNVHDVGSGPATRVAVDWQVLPVEDRPSPLPSLAEADRSLAASLREATEVLAGLDVARLDDDAAEVLAALRGGAFDGPRLPPGHPARADDVAVRARRLAAIVALARADDGAALTAGEAARRREALLPIDRAARQALSAAYSAAATPT
jgi:hypothetical protein